MASAASMGTCWQQRPIEFLPRGREGRKPLKSTKPGPVGHSGSACAKAYERPAPYPTVLIAAANPDARRWLVTTLTQDNYLVLEADCDREVLRFATFHSRPIQVLVLEEHLIDKALMARLARLRPQSQILMLEHEADADAPTTRAVLTKARQLLKPAQ